MIWIGYFARVNADPGCLGRFFGTKATFDDGLHRMNNLLTDHSTMLQRTLQRTAPQLFLLVLGIMLWGCQRDTAEWVAAFGYQSGEVYPIEIGEFGYPYVPVHIQGMRVTLPFDTGNMVGLSVSSELFNDLGLPENSRYQRSNSAGLTVGSLRRADAIAVSFYGRNLGKIPVFEIAHRKLPGLAGPVLLEGGHFTLDYRAGKIAFSETPLPDVIPGFQSLPLVRSDRHPRLILVNGTVEGRPALFELDTGKSRTVVNPRLARELALPEVPRGVSIQNLRLGDRFFSIPSAKRVDQTGIDPALPMPIEVGIGSDILSRFVWTVDYEMGLLWIPVGPDPP